MVHQKIAYPKKKFLSFFYVVDASLTKQPNGILFIGIMRLLGTSSPAEVRLTQNKEFRFKETEALPVYSAAVNWEAGATKKLDDWATLPDTEPLFGISHRTELKEFDFHRPDGRADMHARLYRFQSGDGLVCVPFYVGTPPTIETIYGSVLDVLGTKGKAAEFAAKIDF